VKPALIFLVTTLSTLYQIIMLLRFWLPFLRADFRNPIAQGILKVTSPLIVPVRRIIPPIGKLDTATVLVAFAIQCLTIYVVLLIAGGSAPFSTVALHALVELVLLSLNLFKFAIFIFVILSWFARGTYNPATAFLSMIVEPVLRPFRRYIPPIGMLDLSALFALIALQFLTIFVATLQPLPI
jgi:YggT family protein